MKIKIMSFFIVLLLLATPVFPDKNVDIEQVVTQGVVRIFYDISYVDILGFVQQRTIVGSGVILDSRHVLTNKHLVEGFPVGVFRIHIFKGERTFVRSAFIEKFSITQDLLHLVLDKEVDHDGVRLADEVQFGEDMYFKGYSALKLPLVRIGRVTTNPSMGIYVTPIYNGDSGGGVFNSKGELIGIIYTAYVTKNSKDTLLCGYAIPLEQLKEFLK